MVKFLARICLPIMLSVSALIGVEHACLSTAHAQDSGLVQPYVVAPAAAPAVAPATAPATPVSWSSPTTWVALIGALSMVASLLANAVPPTTRLGRLLHWLALNGPDLQRSAAALQPKPVLLSVKP